jgi:anti-sigma factor RsiW
MSATAEDLSCKELVEIVTDYLEGAMEAHERARFEHHLTECDGCEEYLRRIRSVIRLAGNLEPETIAPTMRERLLSSFRAWKTR